jgi:hypothetical protein
MTFGFTDAKIGVLTYVVACFKRNMVHIVKGADDWIFTYCKGKLSVYFVKKKKKKKKKKSATTDKS